MVPKGILWGRRKTCVVAIPHPPISLPFKMSIETFGHRKKLSKFEVPKTLMPFKAKPFTFKTFSLFSRFHL